MDQPALSAAGAAPHACLYPEDIAGGGARAPLASLQQQHAPQQQQQQRRRQLATRQQHGCYAAPAAAAPDPGDVMKAMKDYIDMLASNMVYQAAGHPAFFGTCSDVVATLAWEGWLCARHSAVAKKTITAWAELAVFHAYLKSGVKIPPESFGENKQPRT